MRLVVKIGGTLLETLESRLRLAEELAAVARQNGLVVVHGGGKQMTRFLSERNLSSHFVRGLRVTTPEVLDAVLKVVAGTVNKELVAAFLRAGVPAVGLSGVDACLLECDRLDEELGAVGRPVRVNSRLLEVLSGSGYVPVVACVGADGQGAIYNVNADQMAAALAGGFRADRLIMLTDVPGVLGADGVILSGLTTSEAEQLAARGIATGGMQAKLAAASQALREGVGAVLIAPGAEPGVVDRLLAGERLGTRLVAG